ncbi:MAG: 30S ribosome-binding factor RbfA [Syntrophales bacterium]
MGGFKRADRVADLIKIEIADILLKQVRDPRIGVITITGVKVADDLRSARVFFVEFGKNECSEGVKEGLKKASGFLRRELGRRLQLRFAPELFFSYDPSFAYGERIEELIAEIHDREGESLQQEEGNASADS